MRALADEHGVEAKSISHHLPDKNAILEFEFGLDLLLEGIERRREAEAVGEPATS